MVSLPLSRECLKCVFGTGIDFRLLCETAFEERDFADYLGGFVGGEETG